MSLSGRNCFSICRGKLGKKEIIHFNLNHMCNRKLVELRLDFSLLILLFLLCASLTECCTNLKRESKIKIEKNGYTNIVIGIEEGVKEDLLLISRIKESFTEASQLLYNITR